MADRFPLIVDSSAEQLQELAVGDNLNLASSGLINADNIQTSGLSVGVMTATSFSGDGSQLTNLPAAGSSTELTASGTLADGSKVIVNADGTVSAVVQTGEPYWITTLGSAGVEQGLGIATDSSGNVYISGQTNFSTAGSVDAIVAKYDSLGSIQWQRMLGGSDGDSAKKLAVDSSGNVYICGRTVGSDKALIAKYNSSGTIQWQRTLDGPSSTYANNIALDSSGNPHICGRHQSDLFVAKYNPLGTLQWQKGLAGTGGAGGGGSEEALGLAIDSSDNVYISGDTNSGPGTPYTDTIIAKYNSSGTIQWQRTFGSNRYTHNSGAAVDSSGNLYICGYDDSTGDVQAYIVKYNSSGTEQWQRKIGGSGGDYAYAIAVDSSGNAYLAGNTGSSGVGGSSDYFISKWNSSGTLQWQRLLGGSGADYAFSIATDSSNNFYIQGYGVATTSNDMIFAKLPGDGTLTGTYGSLTYAASTYTSSTPTLTTATSSFTDYVSTMTDAAGTLTPATPTLTSTVTSVQAATSNLTSENYIGISDGAYTNGQTATVQLIGSVDDAQSGLTPGQKYYVQGDGTLSETADSPSVLAGTAIASTKLLIKK